MRRPATTALLGLVLLAGGCASFRDPTSLPPTAAIDAAPLRGSAPLTVHFDASRSTDDGAIIEYNWDFGDADQDEPVRTPTSEHSYETPGQYTVRLLVIDDCGLVGESTRTIHVVNSPPLANFRLSTDAPGVGEQVVFDASGSIDLDGRIVDVAWDFGDGRSMRGTLVGHAYEAVGLYTVRLTVTDDGGAMDTATHDIAVLAWSGGGGCGGGAVSLSIGRGTQIPAR